MIGLVFNNKINGNFFCDRGVITTEDNFNDYINIGCYRYNGSPENMPEIGTANNWGELCIFKSGNYIVQLGIAALQNIYIRRTTDNVNWTSWVGYAQKSDLQFKLEYAAVSYTTDIVSGTIYERNLDYANAAFVIVATGLYDNVQDSVTVPGYYFKTSGAGTRTIVYYQSASVEVYALGNNKIAIKVGNPVEHQSVKVWALRL